MSLCKSSDVSQRTQAPQCLGIATDLHKKMSKIFSLRYQGKTRANFIHFSFPSNRSALHQAALRSPPSFLRSRQHLAALLSQIFTGSWNPFSPSVSLVSSLLILGITAHTSLPSWWETTQCCLVHRCVLFDKERFSINWTWILHFSHSHSPLYVAGLVHLSVVPPCFWRDGNLISGRM